MLNLKCFSESVKRGVQDVCFSVTDVCWTAAAFIRTIGNIIEQMLLLK